jgi:hypothetical protein
MRFGDAANGGLTWNQWMRRTNQMLISADKSRATYRDRPETARVGCEPGECLPGSRGGNRGVHGVVSDCRSQCTRSSRNASARAFPQRLASSTSWYSRADGYAARSGLRRRRPEKHASNRSVCQAERVAPYSRYAPPATTPQTGRFHARFFRPGPRRGYDPSPVEVIPHPDNMVRPRPVAARLRPPYAFARQLSQNGDRIAALTAPTPTTSMHP